MADPPRDDRRALIGAGLVTLAFFSLVSFTQWITFDLWADVDDAGPAAGLDAAARTITMTFVPSAIVIVGFALAWGQRWDLARRVVALVALPPIASGGRLIGLRLVFGERLAGPPAAVELINGIVPPLLALVVGLYYVDAQDRTRRIQRLIAIREVEAQKALADLEHEELRVRRAVSETLHGRIQQRLVFIAARLVPVCEKAEETGLDAEATALRESIEDLDRLREDEVRQLSQTLYPSGLDIGLHQAMRLEIGRIPATLAVDYRPTPAATAVDDVTNPELTSADRLLLVSAVSEAVTNAVKHAGATSLAIIVDVVDMDGQDMVSVDVVDNASTGAPALTTPRPNPAPIASDGMAMSGLGRLAHRFQARGGGLAFDPGDGAGATLRVWLPRPPAPATGLGGTRGTASHPGVGESITSSH